MVAHDHITPDCSSHLEILALALRIDSIIDSMKARDTVINQDDKNIQQAEHIPKDKEQPSNQHKAAKGPGPRGKPQEG